MGGDGEIRTGISTLVSQTTPLSDLLKKIKRTGFDWVSFSHSLYQFPYYKKDEMESVVNVVKELGLRIDHIHAPIKDYFDLTADDEHIRTSTVEIYKSTIAAVSQLKGRAVVLHLTNDRYIPDDQIESRAENAIPHLYELGDYGEKSSVLVAVENLGSDNNRERVMERAMEMMTHRNVGLCFDSGHSNILSKDPFSVLDSLGNRLFALHLHDNHGQNDDHIIPLGDGTFPWAKFIARLKTTNYRGPLLLEIEMNRIRYNDLDEYLRLAYSAGEGLLSIYRDGKLPLGYRDLT